MYFIKILVAVKDHYPKHNKHEVCCVLLLLYYYICCCVFLQIKSIIFKHFILTHITLFCGLFLIPNILEGQLPYSLLFFFSSLSL